MKSPQSLYLDLKKSTKIDQKVDAIDESKKCTKIDILYLDLKKSYLDLKKCTLKDKNTYWSLKIHHDQFEGELSF